MTDIDTIRGRVTDRQRQVLTAIWTYFLEHGEWIPTRLLHTSFGGKATVRPLLEEPGGSVVFESEGTGLKRYQLTLLGILLTDEGESLEQLLARYLKYTHNRCQSEPLLAHVTSEEIEADLRLSSDQSERLAYLVRMGHFSSGGSFGPRGWKADIPENIEDLPSDPLGYVRVRAIERYDPEAPIGALERQEYFSSRNKKPIPSEFAFVADPGLQRQLDSDWQEAKAVYTVKAWKSCVILCGGILEGMLLDTLMRSECQALEAYSRLRRGKKANKLVRWNLVDLVDVAKELRVLRQGAFHLGHAVRAYRNLIHPGRQVIENLEVTQGEAEIALNSVKTCMRELVSFVHDQDR